MVAELFQTASTLIPEMRAWLRALHEHPETAHEEKWTSAYIRQALDAMGIPYRSPLGATGVLARIGDDPNLPTIALRADFDALPITEESDLSYRSKNPGKGHLCGHDGHTAMLLGAARVILAHRPSLRANALLIFQHAEEVLHGGAGDFIRAGALEGVSAIYGLHNMPDIPAGDVAVLDGPTMASCIRFDIQLGGRGGHAAWPHKCDDLVLAASQVVLEAHAAIPRRIPSGTPWVLSFGEIHTGSAFNVLPSSAKLTGTARVFSQDLGESLRLWVDEILDSCARRHGITAQLDWQISTPPLLNHPACSERIRMAAAKLAQHGMSIAHYDPAMIGEDFAEYLQVVPGCFFFLGTRDEQQGITAQLHSPKFKFNEAVLPHGAALLASSLF